MEQSVTASDLGTTAGGIMDVVALIDDKYVALQLDKFCPCPEILTLNVTLSLAPCMSIVQ